MKIRNIAIIAHVDHGKTTLLNELLKQSDTLADHEQISERAMDANDLEKERGITILAKNTAVFYKDYKINILDTPGHADFGGEVERIMQMIDGVILVVDAYEGTMPQTRFVLKKALEAGAVPIVVINKVDKPSARVDKVLDDIYELFINLGANEEQINFPVLYASALNGTTSSSSDLTTQKKTMNSIFESVIENVPAPESMNVDYLLFQPALIDYNPYVGRMGIGKVLSGKVVTNSMVACSRIDGSVKKFRIQKLFTFRGLKKIEVDEVTQGDICGVAGLEDIFIGETICDMDNIKKLPISQIEQPTIKIKFATNSAPFAGKDGDLLTARKIEARLYKETMKDVSLKFEKVDNEDSWIVNGRGELHLSILIENMRREGFEIEISKPEVVLHKKEGVTYEPYEDVEIEVPELYSGKIIEMLGTRGGEMTNMKNTADAVRFSYVIPSRSLIGFSTEFISSTKGFGIIHHSFKEFRPAAVDSVMQDSRKNGVMIASQQGKSTAYAIAQLESRGTLFIGPGEEVYEGMIVGASSKAYDMVVNIAKAKNLTNMRTSGKDNTIVLKVPKRFTLESALDYIKEDELLEVTPKTFRIRKKYLDEGTRKKHQS